MKKTNIINRTIKWLLRNPVVIATFILIILMLLFVPSFATIQNLLTVAQQISVTGIAAVGLAYVLIGGGNDLSIGSVITFSSVMGAIVMKNIGSPLGLFLGVLTALIVGMLIGLFNGIMVSKIGVNAFMMTLITQMMLEGAALMVTNATAIGGLPSSFLAIGKSKVLGIPAPLYIMLVFFIIGQYVLKKVGFGRKLYATGANKKAAKLVGIPVERIITTSFIFSGFCAASAGIVLSSRLGAATPSAGSYLLLDIMSAAIIGGNSLFGGKGSVVGAAFGVLLLGLISNGLNLLGVSYNATMIVKGGIILFAVVLDYLKERISAKKLLQAG